MSVLVDLAMNAIESFWKKGQYASVAHECMHTVRGSVFACAFWGGMGVCVYVGYESASILIQGRESMLYFIRN